MTNINDLLSRMTLREKIGQMTQMTIEAFAIDGPFKTKKPLELIPEKLREAIVEYGVGSILNVGTHAHSAEKWQHMIATIQQIAQDTRLHIPIIYGIDSIHGANYVLDATLFPQPLAQASSWNLDITRQLSEVSAYETRAAGIPWNFAPAMDMGRNPVWSRLWESFGEDVLTQKLFGLATVQGLQGDDYGHKNRVASCLKHFVGYGAALSGKDRTTAWIPERQLREYFLPQYQASIDAGAASIMVNSGAFNGIPAHANKELLTDILRDEMGFEGVVVTDWWDIIYLHNRHRIAATEKEAVRLAIDAGIDMSMVPYDYKFCELLQQLVEEGSISEARIDESVRRILTLKLRAGLFEQAQYPLSDYPDFGSSQHQALALQAARESLILLKNEQQTLPLKPQQRILVCGPAANTLRSLNGGWTMTWQGDLADELIEGQATILEAIKQFNGTKHTNYLAGCNFTEVTNKIALLEAAQTVDLIIFCGGEDTYCEQFGNVHDFELSAPQIELMEALAELGKPIILTLTQGRPRLIRRVEPLTQAILLGFYPGSAGGQAIAEVLFGQHNPSGMLPLTYPKHPNTLVPYDHTYADVQELNGFDDFLEVQYPFGHGLSYTTFEHSDLKLNKSIYGTTDTIEVSVSVTNTGDHAGRTIIHLFVSDLYASITPSVRRLRAWETAELAAKETCQVNFSVPVSDLAFVGLSQKWIVEPGRFRLTIGKLEEEFGVR